MRCRRQLLAAGLLLAVLWAVPVRALPAGQIETAAAYTDNRPLGAPAALTPRVFLPVVARWLDLAVSRVEVIQGVTLGDSYTTHIAGRPALLRVFVSLDRAASLPGVSVRLRHFVGGVEQGTLTAGPLTVQPVINEGNLSHTFNFNLPAHWLSAGSAYVIDVDPTNAISENNESNNRYPAAGEQPFNFINTAPLHVVIVPVAYKGTTPPTGDLSYLTWMPSQVLPVSQINYSVRGPHPFSGDLTSGSGWSALLNEIRTLHANENPAGDKLYYGLVDSVQADGCQFGCIAGIGYVSNPQYGPVKTSAGFAGFPGSSQNRSAASPTFTHEMGHNFGRRHAPCGNPANPDTSFPYANAGIGQWGYDVSAGTLKNPGAYYDYMSYCGSTSTKWTSDYTYHGIAQAWGWLNAGASSASAAAPAESLMVSGYFGTDGAVHVDPVFLAPGAPPAPLLQSMHRLDLLDAQGRVLATVPFEPLEVIIDLPAGEAHASGFLVQAPPVPGLAGLRLYRGSEVVYERLVGGPAPRLSTPLASPALTAAPDRSVSWRLTAGPVGTRYRVRFSPDGGGTWTVLALETGTPYIEVPADLLAGATAPLVEVQASDGVRTDRQTIPITLP